MGESGGGGCCPPMDLMRSEPMQLVQLIVPMESAHLTVSYLGDLGLVQFKDLNPEKSPFQRTYAAQIKRCGEMARKIRFFKDQMSKAGVLPKDSLENGTHIIDLDDVEVKLGELEAELVEINANNDKLQRSYNELIEYKLVLDKAGEFFSSAHTSATAQQIEIESQQVGEDLLEAPLLQQDKSIDSSKQVKLGFLTGLVPREKSMVFERILFRATRGNVFIRQTVIEEPVIDPNSGEKAEKNVFVVFYSGERAKSKILKICEAFGANRYPFSEDLGKQAQMITEVSGRLTELKTTIDAGLGHRNILLHAIGDKFELWNLKVRKEKAIYHTLNMLSLDVTKKCLVAEGWSPVFASNEIQNALKRAAVDSNSQVGSIFQVLRTKELPPTYFRTNKFTSAIQEIVDAYGVAKYQEANPGVFTIVTFPFLFAVMFGDWGHGICLLLATMYLIVREKKLSSQLNSEKSPFQRTYAAQIKRCGEMARKIRFFKDQMSKAGVLPKDSLENGTDIIDLDDVDVKLGELEAELVEINANNDKLQRSYNELIEYKLVLHKAGEFFSSAHTSSAAQQREIDSQQVGEDLLEAPLLQQDKSIDSSKQVKLGFLTGLVPREKSMVFERILFRATRGNVFIRQTVIEEPVIDPNSGEKAEKNVFVVFYSGERAKSKILKICEAFGANRYPFSEDLGKQAQMISELSGRLSELKTTIDAGLGHRDILLHTIGDKFELWNLKVRKEKAIYHTLNMLSLDVTKKCLVAEGWSPVFASNEIQNALKRAAVDSNSQVGSIFQVLRTKELPPTYFRTNKFTSAIQEIVDAYGVAKYQEANPGVFTIVTFPFLFAVMFGDWGHGICLLLATMYLIVREKKLSSQREIKSQCRECSLTQITRVN
ncbi:hypothetical protein DY000_02036178 [Brassica cretica]|uniref:V-type proton ATPase subunit a n=1 Tax=Brassica cretica TaxID=69181 RepID=A0ABQ7B808_BRACR|nr:hypothetical protein DY000_02036178 [Brassica cretica]